MKMGSANLAVLLTKIFINIKSSEFYKEDKSDDKSSLT